MLFVVYVLLLWMNTGICEAHVFCQDAHATDWTPLGYSCPINCAAVIAAVTRLKEMDYDAMITSQHAPFLVHVSNVSKHDPEDGTHYGPMEAEPATEETGNYGDNWIRKSLRSDNEIDRRELTRSHYMELYRMLLNKNIMKKLQAAVKHANAHRNDTCVNHKEKGNTNHKCTRRATIPHQVLKKLTEILNKENTFNLYFTESLTESILSKFTNENGDLSVGTSDVPRILKYIKGMFSRNRVQPRASTAAITLKPKFCLNIYVPGCFCISGYVEHNGQCVLPADCFPAPAGVRTYLERIHVV